jgi:hypothetical protein
MLHFRPCRSRNRVGRVCLIACDVVPDWLAQLVPRGLIVEAGHLVIAANRRQWSLA